MVNHDARVGCLGVSFFWQVMVISLGAGTHMFQLDRGLGEFVLTKHNLKMPARGRYLAFFLSIRRCTLNRGWCLHTLIGGAGLDLLSIEAEARRDSRLGSKFGRLARSSRLFCDMTLACFAFSGESGGPI